MTPVVAAAVVALVVTSVLWRDQLAVTEAASAGARVASLDAGLGADADGSAPSPSSAGTPTVIGAVARALGGVPPTAIERVVIFGASLDERMRDAVGAVPAGCRFGEGPSPSDPCVLVRADAVVTPALLAGCGPGACPWRDAPGVDVVGVFVRVRQPELLGGLVPAPTVEGVALAPLERGGRG